MGTVRPEERGERLLVEQVHLCELDPVADGGEVLVLVRRVAHEADDLVAAVEQRLGEIRAVLPADHR